MSIRQIVSRTIWFEPFWLLLLGIPITLPGRFVSLSWQPYLVAMLFLCWPLHWYIRLMRKSFNFSNIFELFTIGSPLTIPLLVMICWLPVNLWASADRITSWVAIGYLLLGLTLFVAFVQWPPAQHNLAWVAGFLLSCCIGVAVIAPPFVVWKADFRLFHLPLYAKLQAIHINIGETIHANVLAGILVIVLPLILALLLQPSSLTKLKGSNDSIISVDKSRPFWALFFLLVFFILILTQSRGGYLAAVIAIPLIFTLRWPRLLYIAPLGLLATFLLVHQVGSQVILNQLSTDGSLGGWDGRMDIWIQSFMALHDFAFTGIGIGTFTLIIPLLYPLHVGIEGYPHAHNLFLQIGVDLGLPGLIAYLALLINLFVMLITILRARHATTLQRTLAIGATGSLTAMLVHGLLDAVTWGNKLAFIPWLLFALITLLFLEVEKMQRATLTT